MNGPGRFDEKLAQMELFGELSSHQLRKVSNLGTCVDLAPGWVLTGEGRPGAEFIIILQGTVEVRAGHQALATRGSGDYVGEIALLGNRPRTATVVATTPVAVEVFSRREFWSLLNEVPGLSDQLHATMTDRLTALEAARPQLTLAS